VAARNDIRLRPPCHAPSTVSPARCRTFRCWSAWECPTEYVDALVCAPQGFAGRSIGILESIGTHVGPGFGVASLSSDPTTELGNPPITAVDLAPWTFGREAVGLLAAVLAGESCEYLNRFEKVSVRKAGESSVQTWESL
jgi:hypothetical protein